MRKDPTLRNQDTGLHLGLALGLAGRRSNGLHAVVLRELVERVVEIGIVAIRPFHRAPELGTMMRGAAPKYSSARTVLAVKSETVCVSVASANV